MVPSATVANPALTRPESPMSIAQKCTKYFTIRLLQPQGRSLTSETVNEHTQMTLFSFMQIPSQVRYVNEVLQLVELASLSERL
jgi:hypothetical protein